MASPQPITIPAVIGGQSGRVVVTQPVARIADREHFKRTLPPQLVYLISVLELLAGFVAIITQVVLMLKNPDSSYVAKIGAGIWCGLIYGLTGVVGLTVAKKPTKCSIIAYLLVSILTALISIPFLVISVVGLTSVSRWKIDFLSLLTEYNCNGIQIFLSILIAIAATLGAVFGCRSVCCRGPTARTAITFAPDSTVGFQNLVSGISASGLPTAPPAYGDKC